MDRRIRKTREAILNAFSGLIAEKNFEQITINEIADRADLNRGTVYLHYKDKFDLLDQCIETHLVKLLESCIGEDTACFPSKPALQHAFQYLEQNAAIYHCLLVDRGIPAFRDRLLVVLVQGLSEQVEIHDIYPDVNKEVLVQFLASAIAGTLEWWIRQSTPCPATDIAEHLWLLFERIQVALQMEL